MSKIVHIKIRKDSTLDVQKSVYVEGENNSSIFKCFCGDYYQYFNKYIEFKSNNIAWRTLELGNDTTVFEQALPQNICHGVLYFQILMMKADSSEIFKSKEYSVKFDNSINASEDLVPYITEILNGWENRIQELENNGGGGGGNPIVIGTVETFEAEDGLFEIDENLDNVGFLSDDFELQKTTPNQNGWKVVAIRIATNLKTKITDAYSHISNSGIHYTDEKVDARITGKVDKQAGKDVYSDAQADARVSAGIAGKENTGVAASLVNNATSQIRSEMPFKLLGTISEEFSTTDKHGMEFEQTVPSVWENGHCFWVLVNGVEDVATGIIYNKGLMYYEEASSTWQSLNISSLLAGKADLINGRIPAIQIPNSYDDVIDLVKLSATNPTGSFVVNDLYFKTTDNKIYTYSGTEWGNPLTPEVGKIYVDISTNLTYRWSGTTLSVLDPSLALGETQLTAFDGLRGMVAYNHSQAAHAPVNAQKNSDITQSEIEAKLVNTITTHNHLKREDNEAFGLLYNWWAATGGTFKSGWRLPKEQQILELITYLGGTTQAVSQEDLNYSSNGSRLKSKRDKDVDIFGWDAPNRYPYNTYGFNGIAGGYRDNTGTFNDINVGAYFVTEDERVTQTDFIVYAALAAANEFITTSFFRKKNGLSIRLIRADDIGWYEGEQVLIDGKYYSTCKIGTQIWLTENLSATKYEDGTPIPLVEEDGAWAALITAAYCAYDNDLNYVKVNNFDEQFVEEVTTLTTDFEFSLFDKVLKKIKKTSFANLLIGIKHTFPSWSLAETKPTYTASEVGASMLWNSIAGTRASDTTFTVATDKTAIFLKGLVVKWTESSVVKVAMVSIPSTYSSPNTTVTIVGDTMASIDSGSLKYCLLGCDLIRFASAGNIGAILTDVANSYYANEPMRVIGAEINVGTVASTSGTTTVDINKNGTSFMTTKLTLAYNVASSSTPFTADSGTSLALNDKVTIDVDGITSTTFPNDLYIKLYAFPTRLINLS